MQNENKYVSILILLIVLGILGVTAYFFLIWPANHSLGGAPQENATVSTNTKTLSMPPLTIDKNKTYTATLHTTQGDIRIRLHAKETPITANNFAYLANNHFYDGTIFHRVIKGFMIQGGDPTGTGTGGPGYKFNDEPFSGNYDRGVVAMANAGPNTNGSQFFIMQASNPLPKNYVIFGNVISGMDVVDAIANGPVGQNAGGEVSKPASPVSITTVSIEVQ